MLELCDEFALYVLSRAAGHAAARGRAAVEPDDVLAALRVEHADLVAFALPPGSSPPPTDFAGGQGTAALLRSPRTRALLRESVRDATERFQPVSVGVGNLLVGALRAAGLQPPAAAGEPAHEDLVALAHRIDVAAVADRLRLLAMDTPLDNRLAERIEYDEPRVIPAAVRIAAAAGSRRVEPPHLLRALHAEGATLMRVVLDGLRLDLTALPPRTGPDTEYAPRAAGDRPSFSVDVVRAFHHAEQLEAQWTGQAPVQGSLLAALFATWQPARALLAAGGATQEELERLILGHREGQVLDDAGLVRTLLTRDWHDSPLEPLVDRTTVLGRRCLLVASKVARFMGEPAVGPFQVGVAALHLAAADGSSSLAVALAALGIDANSVAEVSDRTVPAEFTADAHSGRPLPWTEEATAMLLEAPALATRLRRNAVDTCALFVLACGRDADLRTSLEFLGGTQDLLVSAAVAEADVVRGPDALVQPERTTRARRPVLEEPGPALPDEPRSRQKRSRFLDTLFRGESTTGQFANTDLQLGRMLRWRIAIMGETALGLVRLAGTVAAASAGGWWLVLTMVGSGAKPSRLPTWAVLALEAVAVVLLPAWLAVVIAASLVVRGLETWWSLQWRRAATGDPTYDVRRMRRDNWFSASGAWRNALIRRQTAAGERGQAAAGAPA